MSQARGPIVVAGVVGNPKPASRTLAVTQQAHVAVAAALERAGVSTKDGGVVDLATLGAALLADPRGEAVTAVVERVTSADVLLVASPTYKATYTGLLKLVFDLLPGRALAGRVALPLMVAGAPLHALAVEVHLRPLLVELGATVPTPGLALLESQLPEAEVPVEQWAATVAASVAPLFREAS